jgi:seryl-tRNA synthetase
MLDIKFIRENKEAVKKNCEIRNFKVNIDQLLEVDEKRRSLLVEIENLKAQKNQLNDKMVKAEKAEREKLIKEGKNVKDELSAKEPQLEEIEKEYKNLLIRVPNMTHPDSPVGKDDSENKEIERYGNTPEFNFHPKGHEEIMKNLDLADFERAAKVTGAKFYFLKNEGALLEIALTNYAFEILLKEGFSPFITPDLAKDKVLLGIGYNPRGEETQIYSIENSDLNLVGTAEITMGGYHMDEILPEKDLPKKYAALSHCYRTEAGGYGRHSAGLYRVHQFTKIEMFIYCQPEESSEMHDLLKSLEVKIFDGLKIPFRVVDICTGDLGGPAYRKYDLEAFMASRLPQDYNHEGGKIPEEILKQSWGEITSTSNCTDYQARRLNVKIEKEGGKKEYLHMLNGTAIAVSRALIAILENYQQKDGSIIVPEVLRKYTGFDKIERKRS